MAFKMKAQVGNGTDSLSEKGVTATSTMETMMHGRNESI